jgi:hypothetical protein
MNPFPPPMPAASDWRFQLMAAVVIAWVVVLYALLLWAEHRDARRTERVHCADRGTDATVLVRRDFTDRPVDVLRCSLLPGGMTCAQACLRTLVR